MNPYRGTERRRDYRFRLRRAMEYLVLHQAVCQSMSGEATRTGVSRPDLGLVVVRTGRQSLFRPAMGTDVSRRGLGLVIVEAVPLGAFMEVYLLTEDGRPKVSGLVEVVRCIRRGSATEYFNEYYNPDTMVEYELGLRSPGSVLFDRIADLA